jgi:hypothetical protein
VSISITRRGYYRLIVAGAQFSQHSDPNEAIENAAEILATDPSVMVEILPPRITVESKAAGPVTLPSTPPPQSEGGIDLVDFLTMLDEQASGPLVVGTVVDAPDFYSGIHKITVDHRDSGSWLAQRLAVIDADGIPQRVGLTWRGYVLLWNLRDRDAIRVGT